MVVERDAMKQTLINMSLIDVSVTNFYRSLASDLHSIFSEHTCFALRGRGDTDYPVLLLGTRVSV